MDGLDLHLHGRPHADQRERGCGVKRLYSQIVCWWSRQRIKATRKRSVSTEYLREAVETLITWSDEFESGKISLNDMETMIDSFAEGLFYREPVFVSKFIDDRKVANKI
jgi:hypothetical protein